MDGCAHKADPRRNDSTSTCAFLPAVRGSDECLKVGEKPAVVGGSDAALLGNAAACEGPQHSWIILIAQGGYQSCRRGRREENKEKTTATTAVLSDCGAGGVMKATVSRAVGEPEGFKAVEKEGGQRLQRRPARLAACSCSARPPRLAE